MDSTWAMMVTWLLFVVLGTQGVCGDTVSAYAMLECYSQTIAMDVAMCAQCFENCYSLKTAPIYGSGAGWQRSPVWSYQCLFNNPQLGWCQLGCVCGSTLNGGYCGPNTAMFQYRTEQTVFYICSWNSMNTGKTNVWANSLGATSSSMAIQIANGFGYYATGRQLQATGVGNSTHNMHNVSNWYKDGVHHHITPRSVHVYAPANSTYNGRMLIDDTAGIDASSLVSMRADLWLNQANYYNALTADELATVITALLLATQTGYTNDVCGQVYFDKGGLDFFWIQVTYWVGGGSAPTQGVCSNGYLPYGW